MLNRLIAGDFLELLGKELGLEVPPDLPPPNKTKILPPNAAVEANSKSTVDTSAEKKSTSMSLNPQILEDKKVRLLHQDDKEVDESSNLHRKTRSVSLSSEEEKSRRQVSRKDRDSSEDSEDRYRSSSKKSKKESSSRDKRSSSSRKHSKSKHRHRDSRERSGHRSSERDRRRYRD